MIRSALRHTLTITALLLCGHAAQADTLEGTDEASPHFGYGTIAVHNTRTGSDFWTYCIEASQYFADGFDYSFRDAAADRQLTIAHLSQIDRLVTQNFAAAVASANGTGVANVGLQLAIWEVVHDQPLAGGPNWFNTGRFPADFALVADTGFLAPTYLASANAMLAALPTASAGGYRLTIWRSPDSQDLLQISAVPEAQTAWQLAAGLAALGGLAVARRRRRARIG
jgi:MYXO-CTERM domain-containing protein